MFLQHKGLPDYPPGQVVEHARPLLNIPFVPSANIPATRSVNIKLLMSWVKKTPEAISIVNKIAQDIVTKINFEAVDLKKAGRPSRTYKGKIEDRANFFAEKNFLKQELKAAVIDWLITGDAFIWKGKVSETQIKEVVQKKFAQAGLEFKEASFKASEWIDEDYQGINVIQMVASTSMEIVPTDTKISHYLQKVSTKTRKWYPDEIIHAKFIPLDGKVYGFTPMEACSPVIRTMGLIKDYAGTFFENGGVPDYIFSFPKEMANSPSAKMLQQKLQKYKQPNSKHGNIVVTGELKTDPLGMGMHKDMQFNQLALYYTGVLAFAYGMPADTLRVILGGEIKQSTGGSDNEDSGYNQNIEESQEYWETLMNTQCFYTNFKARMKFKRKFMQGWIRLTTGRVQNIGLAKQMIELDFPVTDDFYIDMLKIPREYLTEGKIKRDLIPEGPKPPQLSNIEVLGGPAKQAYSKQKKKQVIEKQRPVGKENLSEVNLNNFFDLLNKWKITEFSDEIVEYDQEIDLAGNLIYHFYITGPTRKTYKTTAKDSELNAFQKQELFRISRRIKKI